MANARAASPRVPAAPHAAHAQVNSPPPNPFWGPPSPQRRAKSEQLGVWSPDEALRGHSSGSEPDGGSWSDTPFQPQPHRAYAAAAAAAPSAPLAIPQTAAEASLARTSSLGSVGRPGSLGERLPSLRDWAGSGGSGSASSRFVYQRQPSLGDWIPAAFLSRGSGGQRQPVDSSIPEAAEAAEQGSSPRMLRPSVPRQRSLRREGPPRSPKRSRSPPTARLSSRGSFGSLQAHQPKAARLDLLVDSALGSVDSPLGEPRSSQEAPEGLSSGFREFTLHAGPPQPQRV